MTVAMRRACGRGGFLAADALNPLDFNLVGCGRVEIFAVCQLGRAEGVEDDVLGLVVGGGGLVGGRGRETVSGRRWASVWMATPGWEALMSQGCGAA